MDGVNFVVYEPALAQASHSEQAARVLSLSRLCQATMHMQALARQQLGYQEAVLPREIADAAAALGFRLTTDAGLARAHKELVSFLAWKSADFMTQTSGFRPMDRFFAVAQGQATASFVYGIGSAEAHGDRLKLLSTRERICHASGELLVSHPDSQHTVFGAYYHSKVWLIPEMDFPGPKDYQGLAVWARETLAARN